MRGLGQMAEQAFKLPAAKARSLLVEPPQKMDTLSGTKHCVLASTAFSASLLLPKLAEHEGHATAHDKGARNGIADGHWDQILDQDVAPRQWCS